MTYALVIAVLAFALAVFGFVDRRALEADMVKLKTIIKAMDDRAKAEIKVIRADAFKEVSALKADFHARLTAVEGKARESKIKAPFAKKPTVKKG